MREKSALRTYRSLRSLKNSAAHDRLCTFGSWVTHRVERHWRPRGHWVWRRRRRWRRRARRLRRRRRLRDEQSSFEGGISIYVTFHDKVGDMQRSQKSINEANQKRAHLDRERGLGRRRRRRGSLRRLGRRGRRRRRRGRRLLWVCRGTCGVETTRQQLSHRAGSTGLPSFHVPEALSFKRLAATSGPKRALTRGDGWPRRRPRRRGALWRRARRRVGALEDERSPRAEDQLHVRLGRDDGPACSRTEVRSVTSRKETWDRHCVDEKHTGDSKTHR